MRIADGQNQAGFLRNLQRVKVEMNDALARMYTGKRVRFASDDPNASAELMRLQESVQKLEARGRGISQSRAWLELTEQAISEMQKILTKARTLAVQASSDLSQGQGYEAIANSVSGLRSQLRGLADYRVSGNYIFSGTMTNTPPFNAAGAYQGNQGKIEIPLDEGSVQINFAGDEIFGQAGSGGPVDLLERFENALRAGDSVAVKAIIDDFDTALTNNSTLIARVGSRRALLEDSDIRIKNRKVEIAARAADLGSADMAKAISDVQRLNTNYQATLAAGSRLFGPNFFDYLG